MSLRTWFDPSTETTSATRTPASSRRSRWGAGRRILRSLVSPFGSAPEGAALLRAPGTNFAEQLEPRLLMTQLVGGDVFYFVQRRNDEELVHRIRLEGNIEVELVGAEVDQRNNLGLRNLSGLLFRGGVQQPVDGGLQPATGTQLLGGLTIPGVANPTINAIAADNAGNIYAFNVITLQDNGGGGGGGTVTDTAQIQLIQLNIPVGGGPVTSTVIVNDLGAALFLTDVTGADFNPVTGQLFFAASQEDATGGGAGTEGSILVSMNVNAPNPNATLGVVGAFVAVPAGGGAPEATTVSSLTFKPDGTLAGNSEAGFFINGPVLQTPNLNPITVLDGSGGGGSSDITGVEFNPYTGDFLAVGSGDVNAEVLNICDNGRALAYGPVGVANLTSLTFVNGLTDPFTGNTAGSFIAVDSASDQVYFVDPTNRRPRQTLWNIYITKSDPTGKISIGFVNPLEAIIADGRRLFDDMRPFEGSVGPLRIRNLNAPPQPLEVDAPGTGSVLLGALSQPACDPNAVVGVPFDAPVSLPVPDPGEPEPFPLLPASVSTLNSGISMNPGQSLGKFLLGGTLMGSVDVRGSIDQMYVGWLLTGRSSGQSVLGLERPENFHVGGDLRSLYVRAPIGTDPVSATLREQPNYVTGFDMQVDGTLGHVWTLDSIYGSIEADNRAEDDPTLGFPADYNQTEMETKTVNNAPAFDSFTFSGDPNFYNDTFTTAEYRGSIASLGQQDMVRTVGVLQADPVLQDFADYYAVGVMAGQTVGVQLLTGGNFGGAAGGGGILAVGVMDPDGRLIASDYSAKRTIDLSGSYFEFVADRPGTYRFVVAQYGNPQFLQSTSAGLLADVPYEMRITKTGDVGIGGITANRQIFDIYAPAGTVDHPAGEDPGFELRNGDLGAIYAGGEFFSPNFGATVRVENGNLRAIDANDVGYGTRVASPDVLANTAAMNFDVTIDVPQGSVGLVRSRDAAGIMWFNYANGQPPAIGGDYQMVDCAGSFLGILNANGGIGVVRTGDMQGPGQSFFFANADNLGNDGIIDLIDCTGNLGSLGIGGPGISTGAGGNVRYMRVGGTALLDRFFGGGSAGSETTHSPGEIVSLKDDSGAGITFTPSDQILNPLFDPITNPTVAQFLAPAASLNIRSYPIRGSGGVAVIDVTSDNSVNIQGTGDAADATAEIGAIIVNGEGPAVLHSNTKRVVPIHPRRARRNNVADLVDFNNPFDPINPGTGGGLGEPDYQSAPNPLELAPDASDADGDGVLDTNLIQPFQRTLEVNVGGPTRVDIFDLIGGFTRSVTTPVGNTFGDQYVATANTFAGQFTRITNSTGGEIVNMRVKSIGDLISDGNIGIAEPHFGTALNPNRVVTGPNTAAAFGTTPFQDQRTGIVVIGDAGDEPGNVISIRSRRSIGNVIVAGSIGNIIADEDGNHDPNDGVFEGIAGPIWADGAADPTAASPDPGGDIYNVDIGEGIAPGGTGAFSRAGIFANRRIDTVTGTNASIRGDIFAGDSGTESYETAVAPAAGNGGNGGGNGGGGGVVVTPTIGTGAGGRERIPDSIGRVLLRGGSIINADIAVATASSRILSLPFASVQQEAADDLSNPFYEIGQVLVTGGGGIIGSQIAAADVGTITVRNGFGIFTTFTSQIGEGRVKGLDTDGYGIRGVQRFGGASQNYVIARGDGSSVSTAHYDDQVRLSEQFDVDPYFGTVPNFLTDIHAVLGTSAATPEIPGRTDTGVIEDSSFRMQRDLDKVTAYEIRANNGLLGASEMNVGNAINQIHVRHQINGLSITTGTMKVFHPAGDVYNLNMTVAGPIKSLAIQGDLANNSQIVTNGPVGNISNVRVDGRLDGTIRANGKIGKMFVGESVTGKIASTRTRGRGNALDSLVIGGELTEGGLEIDGNVGKIQVAHDLGLTGQNLFIRGSIKSLVVAGNLFSNVTVRDKLGSLKVGGSIMSGSTIDAGEIGSITVGGDFQAGATIRTKKIGKQRFGGQLLGTIDLV